MKKFSKILVIVLALATLVGACFAFAACNDNDDTIVVYTNAFFAPFEYYEGTNIVGVDIDIMNKVGERMDREVQFQNVEFGVIIDEVSSGKMCDVGAAGITWTEERAEKVAFSVPYYNAVQYVIFAEGSIETSKNAAGDDVVMWSALGFLLVLAVLCVLIQLPATAQLTLPGGAAAGPLRLRLCGAHADGDGPQAGARLRNASAHGLPGIIDLRLHLCNVY